MNATAEDKVNNSCNPSVYLHVGSFIDLILSVEQYGQCCFHRRFFNVPHFCIYVKKWTWILSDKGKKRTIFWNILIILPIDNKWYHKILIRYNKQISICNCKKVHLSNRLKFVIGRLLEEYLFYIPRSLGVIDLLSPIQNLVTITLVPEFGYQP